MYARIRVLTTEGPKEVDVQDPEDASLAARHWNAVKQFLLTGNPIPLAEFENETIEGNALETDPDAIEAWDRAGALDFEEIYES
jgi:hypothetical protein